MVRNDGIFYVSRMVLVDAPISGKAAEPSGSPNEELPGQRRQGTADADRAEDIDNTGCFG